MYGSSAQYGWGNGPRPSDVVLPMAPVRRRSGNMWCGSCISWLSFGIVLSLHAAATLALGVADVVLTYQTYMVDKKCKDTPNELICDKNNLVWSWLATGIWASLPIFIYGILAIRLGKSRHPVRSSWFEFFAFISAFIFAPAMVVLSAIQVYKGHNVYYWSALEGGDDLAKAIIPIVIAGLGFNEFLVSFIAITYICCCGADYTARQEVVTYRQAQPVVDVGQRTYIQSSRPAITCGGDCQTNFNPRIPNPPRVTACSAPGQSCGGGGVYYRPATTTGFAPRPTTYNYFSNARTSGGSPYNWRG